MEHFTGEEADLIDECRSRMTKGNTKIDPALAADKLVTKWRLWVPKGWAAGEKGLTPELSSRETHGYAGSVSSATEGNDVTIKRDEILRILEEHRETIKSYGVKRLGLFGSAARGEERKTSDLDFVVEFEKMSFDSYMDLKAFLEELFHRRVDLVLADAIKPRLRENILKDAAYAPGL